MIFSIICPAFNEEKYIGSILENFVKNCPQPSELFVADAGSTDRTIEIVKEWELRHSGIHLVENPSLYVSHAFNTCFHISSGRYVALLGAHATYKTSFFNSALNELEANHADVVGGPLNQIGVGEWGHAIAWCMSTRFGVGGTEFRVSKRRSFVDSVAFAFYKREIFEQIGLFDAELKRNQDDEMHYRMRDSGYRILMVPEMECGYMVRSDLKGLFKQYFEYGLFKPLVLRKVASGTHVRHLVPPIFFSYLLLLPLAMWIMDYIALVPLAFYLLLSVAFAFQNQQPLGIRLRSVLVYPVLHISYGMGFIMGLFKLSNVRH